MEDSHKKFGGVEGEQKSQKNKVNELCCNYYF